MPRLQAGQGRVKVRGPGYPCTHRRVRPGERGSGPERCWKGPRCPDEYLRRRETPHPDAGRPAGPPTWGSPASRRRRAGSPPKPALTWVGASACAESCPRGSGSGPGSGVPRGDPAYGGGRGRSEERVSRAKMASAPPRCHVADTPRHAPRSASTGPPAPHPPRTGRSAPPSTSFCPHPPSQRDSDQSFPRS